VCVPTLVFAGAATITQAVCLAPLLFGSAHVHHFFEERKRLVLFASAGGGFGEEDASSRDEDETRDDGRRAQREALLGKDRVSYRNATKKTLIAVAAQFAYTSLFGAFASFCMLRTGNVCGPVAAHAFCNVLGVPDVGSALRSRHKHIVLLSYACGVLAFAHALWPLTDPAAHPGSRWDDLVAISERRS
jgi:prenyl protein peptidase